jgi:plastocyanin
MTTRRLLTLLAAAFAAVLVAVLALAVRSPAPRATSTAAASAVHSGHFTVSVSDYAFQPAKLTVTAGTRVTFTNHDNTAHTATADNGAFGTGTINPGTSRTVTLRRPGRYPYHCVFHAFMTGTITVLAK